MIALDGGFDWLTTLSHNSLQLIIAQSLISTLYDSLEHMLSLFQPAVLSLDVSWYRILTIPIPLLPCSKSSLNGSPFHLNYSCFNCPEYYQSRVIWPPRRQHRKFSFYYWNVFTESLHRNDRGVDRSEFIGTLLVAHQRTINTRTFIVACV
jgi:hypothetical protein